MEPTAEDYRWAQGIAIKICAAARAKHLAEDCGQAACIALWQCSSKFDPSVGTSLRQWAKRRVNGAVVDELRRQKWIAREYNGEFGLSDREIIALDVWIKGLGGDAPQCLALQPDYIIDQVYERERTEQLHGLMGVLSPRYCSVVSEVYLRERLMQEVCKDENVNASRIGHICAKSIRQMREAA